jgi:lysozyme family protein
MQNYFVRGTVRDRDCDKTAAIASLVLTETYNGFGIHAVGDLYNLAAAGYLWSRCDKTGKTAQVRIFWSNHYNRWSATIF